MKGNKEIIKFILFVLILVIVIYLLFSPIENLIKNPEIAQERISQYGILAPLLFIALGVVEIIIPIIPGQAVNFLGGYTFGILMGTVYSIISSILGLFIVFSMVKLFGRPLVTKMISKKSLEKFDYITHKEGIIPIFLLFFIPVFPSDAIAYLVGLTSLRLKTLLSIAVLARIPGTIIFTAVGAGIGLKNIFIIFALIAIIIISAILYFKRDAIINRTNKIK
jgi:uncharacterized membrane protein YdjX (TVP38/TMEM64 family)